MTDRRFKHHEEMVVGVGINTLTGIAQVDGAISTPKPLSLNVPHTTIAKRNTVPQIFQVFWERVNVFFLAQFLCRERKANEKTYLSGHRILD
jgi:hypothetical protein